jgi:hypothetical protein
MLYSCLLLWCCKCVIGTPQQKHLEIAYSPLVARDMILQQHAYKLCIVIDLVYNNQYWRMFHWPSSQGTLQVTELLVPIGYFCDGLEHIPPWFKPQLQLAQQATWFMHQLPLHPKMKFGLIHKISTSTQSHNEKPTYIALFSVASWRHPRNTLKKHANEIPKHSNDYFVYSDKYIHHDQDFCSGSWYNCL